MAVARRPLPQLELEDALVSHERALGALNRSPNTIKARRSAVTQLIAVCAQHGFSTVVTLVPRKAIETFLIELLDTHKPTTVQARFDQLHAFFSWLVDEGEVDEFANPMRKIKRPAAPIEEVDLLSDEDARRLLKTCDPKTFDGRRDAAILRMFLDMGGRVGGLASMTTDPRRLDFRAQEVTIVLKGGDEHTAPFGGKTVQALDRYLRVRAGHAHSGNVALWLGQKGPLTESGIAQMIKRRGRLAGVTLHSHMFRHRLCDWWLSNGGNETDLVTLMGWSSRKQLERYAKKGQKRRMGMAHRRLGPGDHI